MSSEKIFIANLAKRIGQKSSSTSNKLLGNNNLETVQGTLTQNGNVIQFTFNSDSASTYLAGWESTVYFVASPPTSEKLFNSDAIVAYLDPMDFSNFSPETVKQVYDMGVGYSFDFNKYLQYVNSLYPNEKDYIYNFYKGTYYIVISSYKNNGDVGKGVGKGFATNMTFTIM